HVAVVALFRQWFLVASERVAALTRALSLAVIGAGACGLLAGAWNVTLLWIGVFLFGGARREAAAAAFIHVRQLARKKDDLADQDSAPVRLIAARVGAPVSAAVRRFVPGRCHIIQLFDEQGRLSGQLAEAEVIDQFFKEGPASPLGPPKRS